MTLEIPLASYFFNTLFLYIRTSKFCLRLAVLKFFSFLRLKCSNLFLFAQLNLAMPQRRMSDWVGMIKIHCFILFLSGSTHDMTYMSCHRQPLGGVLQKNWFCNCAKTNQKIPMKEFNLFIKVEGFLQLYLSWTPSQVFFIDFEHRCSHIICRLAIMKNTFSNIFTECLQWLLLNITSVLREYSKF